EDADRAGSSTADQRRGGAAVVRCLERRSVVEAVAAVELSAQGPHRGDLDGLVVVQGRKDARQALGQQRLPGSRGPAQQQVVTAGGGDFESEPALGLALDLTEVVQFRRDG